MTTPSKRITLSLPNELHARLQHRKHLFNISALVAVALDAKLSELEASDKALLAAADELEKHGLSPGLATQLRGRVTAPAEEDEDDG